MYKMDALKQKCTVLKPTVTFHRQNEITAYRSSWTLLGLRVPFSPVTFPG